MTIGGVQFDLKITFLIILTTVVPMLDYYNFQLTSSKAIDRLLFYFVIPMLVILVFFRDSPADYGFRLGKWQTGLAWTAGACTGMAIILWFVARQPSMQAYYQARAPQELWRIVFINGVDLFSWEFIWRGVLLFAFAREFGPGAAIFLQAVPFAFMHLNKPAVETLSTIFGGAGFGFVAWQSESFLYPWLIHWFIATLTMVIATRV